VADGVVEVLAWVVAHVESPHHRSRDRMLFVGLKETICRTPTA
jgi:hypothetical protein